MQGKLYGASRGYPARAVPNPRGTGMADEQHQINIENARSLGRIEEALDQMNTRLFGGPGQQGALHYITEQQKEAAATVEKETKALDVRVGSLERWKLGSRRWIAGAVAVLALEGSALAMYFNHIASTVQHIFSNTPPTH